MAETPVFPCDVAFAAEFDRWETAPAAEARALFFLASWLERGCAFPLHLACVGEPPSSVRALAAAAGARVWAAANRREALAGPFQTGRVLLVGAETLVLRSTAQWTTPPATSRLLLTPVSNRARAEMKGASEPMWPFYQARSFWTSDPGAVKEAWATYLGLQPDERVALTLAAQALGPAGRLPHPFCARLPHWETGALRPGDTCLLQAPGLFEGLQDASQIPARLEAFGARLETAARAGVAQRGWWTQRVTRRGARAVRAGLKRLLQRRVAPALRASGAYV